VKLRIQGNSLRLRVAQQELTELRDGGSVGSLVEFSPGQDLIYLLEGSRHTKAVTAAFDGQAIRVTVPEYVMKEWAEVTGLASRRGLKRACICSSKQKSMSPRPRRTGSRRLCASAGVLTL
jgi:hypothetical protein